MKLQTNAKGGCFVGGVTEPVIAVAAQATELITKGMANRSVGETKMNSESSRSHSLLRFVIESRDKSDASGAVRIAELNLVDLAGSERQSHTQATGTRLKEGANINKSLLTLSNVIAKLSEGAVGQHIPYRDSKLTRMLERALGGNSRTAIICTVTNAAVHGEETLSTLKFATRAKTIKNTAEVNEVLDDQAMLRKYKKEIDQLKKKLRYTSAGGEKDMEICNMINQLQSLQDENAALECEKQELIVRQGKLTDLVISAGASMSIEAAAEAHARKLKATTRQVLTLLAYWLLS
jgi:centromeric protein E